MFTIEQHFYQLILKFRADDKIHLIMNVNVVFEIQYNKGKLFVKTVRANEKDSIRYQFPYDHRQVEQYPTAFVSSSSVTSMKCTSTRHSSSISNVSTLVRICATAVGNLVCDQNGVYPGIHRYPGPMLRIDDGIDDC